MYSISGRDKRFPALFQTVLRSGYALPHPNCRHEFIPYFEEIEDPADVEKAIKNSRIQYDSKGNLVDVRWQSQIELYQKWQAGNRQGNDEAHEYEQMRAYYQSRGLPSPYSTLAAFRRASRARDEEFLERQAVWTGKTKEKELTGETEKDTAHIFICNSLGRANKKLRERFAIKSEDIIITDKQYQMHIAKGVNTHDDIFDQIKESIPDIINNPDYVFESDKKEDTVIYVSMKYKTQIIVKLNTQDIKLSNTIITIFGCGESTLKRLKKKNIILYEKGIDKD